MLENSVVALDLAQGVAAEGNPNSVSDAGVAGACALAAAEGAALNVRINLPSLTDDKVAGEIGAGMIEMLDSARAKAKEVSATVDRVLEETAG